ncbi:hypothetical protein FOA52_007744 [Chlamydomonas sp. UWO 241]|nr:hypothetical protein FOA52_007744 [Chlamydomonas sp. UWO 241]
MAEPAFGWGGAKRGMTGVVRGISEAAGTCLIDFPDCGAYFRSQLDELEVVGPELTEQLLDDSDEGGDLAELWAKPCAFRNKRNPKTRDYKHKGTHEGLWLSSRSAPKWCVKLRRSSRSPIFDHSTALGHSL